MKRDICMKIQTNQKKTKQLPTNYRTETGVYKLKDNNNKYPNCEDINKLIYIEDNQMKSNDKNKDQSELNKIATLTETNDEEYLIENDINLDGIETNLILIKYPDDQKKRVGYIPISSIHNLFTSNSFILYPEYLKSGHCIHKPALINQSINKEIGYLIKKKRKQIRNIIYINKILRKYLGVDVESITIDSPVDQSVLSILLITMMKMGLAYKDHEDSIQLFLYEKVECSDDISTTDGTNDISKTNDINDIRTASGINKQATNDISKTNGINKQATNGVNKQTTNGTNKKTETKRYMASSKPPILLNHQTKMSDIKDLCSYMISLNLIDSPIVSRAFPIKTSFHVDIEFLQMKNKNESIGYRLMKHKNIMIELRDNYIFYKKNNKEKYIGPIRINNVRYEEKDKKNRNVIQFYTKDGGYWLKTRNNDNTHELLNGLQIIYEETAEKRLCEVYSKNEIEKVIIEEVEEKCEKSVSEEETMAIIERENSNKGVGNMTGERSNSVDEMNKGSINDGTKNIIGERGRSVDDGVNKGGVNNDGITDMVEDRSRGVDGTNNDMNHDINKGVDDDMKNCVSDAADEVGSDAIDKHEANKKTTNQEDDYYSRHDNFYGIKGLNGFLGYESGFRQVPPSNLKEIIEINQSNSEINEYESENETVRCLLSRQLIKEDYDNFTKTFKKGFEKYWKQKEYYIRFRKELSEINGHLCHLLQRLMSLSKRGYKSKTSSKVMELYSEYETINDIIDGRKLVGTINEKFINSMIENVGFLVLEYLLYDVDENHNEIKRDLFHLDDLIGKDRNKDEDMVKDRDMGKDVETWSTDIVTGKDNESNEEESALIGLEDMLKSDLVKSTETGLKHVSNHSRILQMVRKNRLKGIEGSHDTIDRLVTTIKEISKDNKISESNKVIDLEEVYKNKTNKKEEIEDIVDISQSNKYDGILLEEL
eukprot:GHVP01031603.1.p1 GENE.GHVP01031603.1~~GHVP01031603.1.p1  ORF type:complete len:939 (+),score=180.08 GHVP01031603.1:210-3026(+)